MYDKSSLETHSGADTGGGAQDLRTPLRFQNYSSIALKGKKSLWKTGKISIF